MQEFLLPLHSVMRWLVFSSLFIAILVAIKGVTSDASFTKVVNHLRHWTATTLHIQLLIGIYLYTQSAVAMYYWKGGFEGWNEPFFFAVVHSLLMVTAVVFVTIGSAKSKRKPTDREKYRTMLIYFLIGFVIILLAIPWPFSPLANRPYFRPF